MNLTFWIPFILTAGTFLTGAVFLLDKLVLARRRTVAGHEMSAFVRESRSFFPLLLIVLLVRSFILQPYRVPTGSLTPTVLPGDFIAVSQYAYGLRLPLSHKKIMKVGEPKIGEIALFRWPVDPSIVFVKRVIGVPGTHIVYKNKTLFINGNEAEQVFDKKGYDEENAGMVIPVEQRIENLEGVTHALQVIPRGGLVNDFDITVPEGKYFMMGDNRDMSDDSRKWGYVPEENLIGKALMVWMSWDSNHHKVRWHRIGTKV